MKSLRIPQFDAYVRFHDLPGDEPAFVMLHGLGSASSADFPSITRGPGLSRSRFILPDFLGFGYSDRPGDFDYSLQAHAETIFEILNHLNLSGVHLFGHSMGGTIAVVLAAAHPKLVARLVLAESNLDPGKSEASRMIAGQSERDYVTRGHAQFIQSIRQGIREAPGLASYAGALEIADPKAMYRSAVGLMQETRPTPRERFLSIKIPRAFMVGEHTLPDPDVERLQADGIDVLTVPQAGHAMMHDNPDGFTSTLLRAFQMKKAPEQSLVKQLI